MTLRQLIDETAKQSFVEGYKATDEEVATLKASGKWGKKSEKTD